MLIKKAVFVTSSTTLKQSPTDGLLEFAFIGRSNVGKSSLINMLCAKKNLAKTSGTPGKTQLINHFLINDLWYLVDLPGYGWAKVSKSKKEAWDEMIRNYLLKREALACTFVLVDSRLEPQKIDVDFINWLGSKEVPFAVIFTKSDKHSRNKAVSSVKRFNKHLSQYWDTLPPIFLSSSVSQDGKKEILEYINGILNDFDNR